MNIFNSVVIFGSNAVPWNLWKAIFRWTTVLYSHKLDGIQSDSNFRIMRRLISA